MIGNRSPSRIKVRYTVWTLVRPGGETSIVFKHSDALRHHVSKLEHMNDGTPSGQWVDQTVVSLNTTHLGVGFDVRSSGQPVLLVENRTSMVLHSTTSLTALQQDVATTGTMGQWLGSMATSDNKQVLAYTSGAGKQIYASTQGTTGWNNELVRTSATLSSPIEVSVNARTPTFGLPTRPNQPAGTGCWRRKLVLDHPRR